MAEHTPTPWVWMKQTFFGNEFLVGIKQDNGGRWVCSAEEEVQSEVQRLSHIDISDADAEHIVRCVNSHDKLVEACLANIAAFEKIDAQTPWSELEPKWWLEWSEQCRKLRAALKAAVEGA